MRSRGQPRASAGGRSTTAPVVGDAHRAASAAADRALDGADAEGGDDGQHQVDQAGDAEEQEGLLGDARGDAGLAQRVGEADRRDERGVLEQDQPEIGEAGQGDADQLRQDRPAASSGHRDRPMRIAALVLAARDGAEGRQEDLAGDRTRRRRRARSCRRRSC